MTYDQLFQVAQNRGVVRWEKSGAIELLRIASNGKQVLATPLGSQRSHIIRQHADVTTYFCAQVNLRELDRKHKAT